LTVEDHIKSQSHEFTFVPFQNFGGTSQRITYFIEGLPGRLRYAPIKLL
jgi:hypothetical protein